MTPTLYKIVKQAEDDTWRDLNSYKTLVDAMKHTRSEIFAICLAKRIVDYCIEQCDESNKPELAAKLKSLIEKQ